MALANHVLGASLGISIGTGSVGSYVALFVQQFLLSLTCGGKVALELRQ